MLIEQTTTYSYKLKYLDNPTFDKVRDFAKKFIDDLPKELVDGLYEEINRGVDQLTTEPQMLVYLYSFGNMHQAKLNVAFGHIPEVFFDQPEINIIDYGCGQGIGTMCYADFLSQKGITQNIKSVTLIEPSEISLKRAALHVSKFFPNAEISTINKTFDELSDDDINCEEDVPTLHIMSNVLDLLDFDLERFAELINDRMKGYNQFVCVGPYFGFQEKDKRMEDLYLLLNGDENFCKFYEKYELNVNKAWTAQVRCFSVGELEEDLSTEVTEEEIENGVEDEFGVVYSRDGKRLLKGKYKLKSYIIKNGTKLICDGAFYNDNIKGKLQQVIIPNSVVSIGDDAFGNNSSLKKIIIPNSVKYIGANPFYNCKNVEVISKTSRFIVKDGFLINSDNHTIISNLKRCNNIVIPNTITNIGNSAFRGWYDLQQIIIPNSVTSIGKFAFFGCRSLEHIIIPNSVTIIGGGAFGYNSSLKKINIPNSVKCIDANPFFECESVEVISKSSRFIIKDGLLIDNDNQTIISNLGRCNNVEIPNTITIIGDSAFRGCTVLRQITIPNSITRIEADAFKDCMELQKVTIPISVTRIGKGAFNGCRLLQQFIIPESVTNIEEETFKQCESLKEIIIPNSVKSIGREAYMFCFSLKKIAISKSVTSIGAKTFVCCRSLQNIVIPNSVKTIGESAFYYCTSLQQIIIPNAVTSIRKKTFGMCTSLVHITVPQSVTSIGEEAFVWCQSLQQITIPDSTKRIDKKAFKYCTSLQIVSIPNSVTSIRDSTFSDCRSLQEIIISEGSVDKFKQMLPEKLWDKLYYLKKAIEPPSNDDLPF